MIEQFVQRNLNKTVDFLCRTGNGSIAVISMTAPELQAVTMQNNRNWIGAYRQLLCAESSHHPEIIYFCACCGAVCNFLRNHSLVLHNKEKNVAYERSTMRSPDFKSDPFCDFIVAMCNKDVPLLLECIALLPLFWDAYLLLADIADEFIFVDGPLSPYFYMLLKVKKDIDPPDCTADFVKGILPSLDILPYDIQTDDLNLLGAFLYACGHAEAACLIFDRIFFGISGASRDASNSKQVGAEAGRPGACSVGRSKVGADYNGAYIDTDLNCTLEENNGGNVPSIKWVSLDEDKHALPTDNHSCIAAHAQCTAISALLNRKARNDAKIEQLIGRLNTAASSDAVQGGPCMGFCKSFEYADIAAYILSTKNSPRLLCLIELLKMDYPSGPETYTARGIYQSSLENHKKAKHFFRKSLRVRSSLDVLSMLAHTHIHLGERTEAIEVFSSALRLVPPSFRLLYSVAQGYFRLRMFEQSLFYARQALQSKSDGAVWKLVGRIHLQLQDYSAGAHALHKAFRMGEPDALLYLAELYKKLGRHERVADFYEKYVQVGEKNKNAVLAYLIEYFKERGDVEKSGLYRAMII